MIPIRANAGYDAAAVGVIGGPPPPGRRSLARRRCRRRRSRRRRFRHGLLCRPRHSPDNHRASNAAVAGGGLRRRSTRQLRFRSSPLSMSAAALAAAKRQWTVAGPGCACGRRINESPAIGGPAWSSLSTPAQSRRPPGRKRDTGGGGGLRGRSGPRLSGNEKSGETVLESRARPHRPPRQHWPQAARRRSRGSCWQPAGESEAAQFNASVTVQLRFRSSPASMSAAALAVAPQQSEAGPRCASSSRRRGGWLGGPGPAQLGLWST